MITVQDRVTRAREVVALGVESGGFHAGLDEQAQHGYSIHAALDAGREAGVPFSLAAGRTVDRSRDVRAAGAWSWPVMRPAVRSPRRRPRSRRGARDAAS